MFTRPVLYHPYKPPVPVSPAGFRIADYISPKRCFNLFRGPNLTDTRSPAPSPLSSPVKGPRHPHDDPPPTMRLADLFVGHGLGTPPNPSTPSPQHPRNAAPHAQQDDAPAQDPLPNRPRRKGKHGPKHLSFNHGALRGGFVPPRRRAHQMKEKRETVRRRILDRHERRVVRARERIDDLRKEAETLMKPEHMDEQDKIFLKQLQALQLDQVLKHDLEQCRQRMSRAADESTKRREEHEERDEEAAKMWGEGPDGKAQEEQKKKVEAFVRAKEERVEARRRRIEEAAIRAEEERRRAHEVQERKIREKQERLFRQEMARRIKEVEVEERRMREVEERRLREARERQLREERERQLREERERQLREERERQLREERERLLREEVERLRRVAHEHFLREERMRLAREEQERHAHSLAEQTRRHFILYEGKWNELRTSNSLPPIDIREMPWPMFGVVSSAEQITYEDVRTFIFHPQRPDAEGKKTARDKVKSEVLRFHPDKFNARIVPKIQPSQRAIAQEIAGAIARILTRLMTEEVEEQK